MDTAFLHTALNVIDIDKSIEFYGQALNLQETARLELPGMTLVYLGDGSTEHTLELTSQTGRTEPYALGDRPYHIAFSVSNIAAMHELHSSMNCICKEITALGIYFIEDPDGHLLEILPEGWLKKQKITNNL